MEDHYNLSDDSLEVQLHECTLDPSLFSHEAHLRVTWVHINKYGVGKAIENITGDLKAFVSHLGAEEKYHETLTVASIKVLHHFMQKASISDFRKIIELYPELVSDFKRLIYTHYSPGVMDSARAKKEYIKPDLLPF